MSSPFEEAPSVEDVVRFSRQGLRGHKLMLALGCTNGKLYRRLKYAREQGLLPQRHPEHPNARWLVHNALRKRGVKAGRVQHLDKLLSYEEREWLVDQIPDGGTLVEVLASMVRDAYAECMD